MKRIIVKKHSICCSIITILLIALFNPLHIQATEIASIREASIFSQEITENIESTRYNTDWTFAAQTPEVVAFFDYKGNYNVASYRESVLTIYRYMGNLSSIESTLTLTNPYSLFGDVLTDNSGNYYVVWGQVDSDKKNCVVTCLAKYDYSGKLLGKCEITGYENNPYIEWGTSGDYWGTMIPFDSGNCELSINGDIITCNYARTMYNGHQSNYVFYVQMSTMTRLYGNRNTPYCSHSFDQDVIANSDGGFLYANHGDAFPRGFQITKVNPDGRINSNVTTFHFREGSNRDHGYNETYAQFGGLVETANAYVLCASSEKTLSLDTAPTNIYCGHNETRNLFIQILKKDFYKYSGENMYYVSGATRTAIGTAPKDAKTELYLSSGTTDYGVIWITDLDDNHFACNPKIMNIEDGKFVVLWEELSYEDYTGDSYYEVLNENGEVVIPKTKIPSTYLIGNTDVSYYNNSIYWVTNDENGKFLHLLDISDHNYQKVTVTEATCNSTGIARYVCKDCNEPWSLVSDIELPKLTHQEAVRIVPATIKGDGKIIKYCSLCNATINSKVIQKIKTVSLSYNEKVYTGNLLNPKVIIKDSAGKTISSKNYTVSNYSNRNVGKASVTIKLKGNYSGTVRKYFRINPKNTNISKLTAASKGFKVTWKKQATQTSGYEIQHATDKKFTKNKKTQNISSNKTISKSVTKLKGSTKYYVRIRTYKTVNGTRYYSDWNLYSKTIKTKK